MLLYNGGVGHENEPWKSNMPRVWCECFWKELHTRVWLLSIQKRRLTVKQSCSVPIH